VVLTRAGADVAVAEDGRAACEKVLEAWKSGRPFDMVLMDIQMPELDGFSATRKLRDAGYSGAIVAHTAHEGPHTRQRCLQAGCNDYVAKPITQDVVCALLSDHLQRSQPDADRRRSPPTPRT
jgi:CheY-like chemotaxis protein